MDLATFIAAVIDNPFIPHDPTDKQTDFLKSDVLDAFYGGAAGGGKSEALLIGALMFVEVPGYAALLLRRTYVDLALPEALMARAEEWLQNTDATWDGTMKKWTFPSSATLNFGYLEKRQDKYRYQSAAFQYIGFDELTQFPEFDFRYLFSRLRRLKDFEVPIRMRSASNPGNIGHDWVKGRYISPSSEEMSIQDRLFVPALLEDNPYIDQQEYIISLAQLDPVTEAQLRRGDWDVALQGNLFKRGGFDPVAGAHAPAQKSMRRVRFWDMAATKQKEGEDPDCTVGLLMGEFRGYFYILDVVRTQEDPGEVEDLIKKTAAVDGRAVMIRMEQEPGSSGKSSIHHFARTVLPGYNFQGIPSTGKKEDRARPVSSACKNGLVKMLIAPWNSAFLNEVTAFPMAPHDDQVDALSGAHLSLMGKGGDPDRFSDVRRGRMRR